MNIAHGNARTHNFIMQNENIDDITLLAIENYSNNIAPNEIIEEGGFDFSVDKIKE